MLLQMYKISNIICWQIPTDVSAHCMNTKPHTYGKVNVPAGLIATANVTLVIYHSKIPGSLAINSYH